MNFNILTEKEVILTNKEVLPNSFIMGDCLEVMKHIPDECFTKKQVSSNPKASCSTRILNQNLYS